MVAVNDLDEHLGDLHSFITEREIELLHELGSQVCEVAPMLARLAEQVAEVDCLLCFAQAAKLYNYTRPTLRDDLVLRIQAGRHPIQELFVDSFQPNDIIIEGGCGLDVQSGHESVQILTGANGFGKSAYLKQTALIVFMAQIGSFVPAESADIGIVDQIFTRLQTKENVSRSQSSFMIDVSQVSNAFQNCTSKSLVLLDEFGKGTLSQDGASIFAATIWEFLELGRNCPRVLAATHFHQGFHEDILPASLPIRASHMEISLGQSKDQVDDDGTPILHFLYRIAMGHATTSHAAYCARACGISEDIIHRAAYIKSLADDHELDTLRLESLGLVDEDLESDASCINGTSKHAIPNSELQDAQATVRQFLEWDLDHE
ncbi:unnamed protein product [Sympodiomycopsis kandeliae]